MAFVLKQISVLSLFILTCSANVFAELNEIQMLEYGMANSHIQARFAAQLEAATAKVEATGNWSNPRIEYSQENLDLVGGPSEETTLWLRQEINIAGVNRLNKRSAELSKNADELSVQLARREWQRELRQTFYQLLAAEQLAQTLQENQRRLTVITRDVQRRVVQGDASRFDVLRIEQELAILNSRYQQADIDRNSHQTQLFNYLERAVEPITGNLTPPVLNISNAFNQDNSLHLKALTAKRESFQTQSKAYRREAWPTLTVGIGRKELNEPVFNTDGETFSIDIQIPLFNRGSGDAKVADSRAREIQSDIALLRQQLRGEYDAAYQTYQTQRQSAEALQLLTNNNQSSLSQIAEVSYRAGELGVIELLDAYRSDLAATEQFIESALKARQAYINLQFFRGE